MNLNIEIPFLFDLSKDSQYIQEEVKLSDSFYIDSNNHLFVPTPQNIFVLSLKKRALNKNWIKHCIQIPALIKDYKKKGAREFFYRDKYTSIFNDTDTNDKELDFLNYSTDKDFEFNAGILRNRLIYMNSFDNFSLKLTKFMISSIGMTRRNKPILSIIMNNSECYLLSYHDENSIKEYKIEISINSFLLEISKIKECEEICSMNWSNEIINENGDIMLFFGVHLLSKIFLWEILKDEKQSVIDIKLFAEIPLPEFPYKSSHIIIDSCPYNSNVLHINVFSQSKKILLLEYHKNEKTPIRKEVIDTDCYSFEIIKKTEQIFLNEERCNCIFLIASNNKIFELQVREKILKQIFIINEPTHFTSILIMDDKLILSTISNLVYFFNYDATLQNSTNDSNLNNQLYTFKTLTNLKGFILSRNKLLKIAIGNAHKQKTHCSNIVISANIKYTMPVEEILLKLVISFKKKLHKNFTLKEPLNLDDLLCILAENHDIFIELVAFLKALLEEQNNLDSLVKIKKHSFNKQMLSLAKKKIDELVPNKELQNFILGRLFFNIIMIHKEDFAFFIKDAKRNFLDNFYKNLLKTNFNDIILKIQEENQKNLLENIKYNLKSFIADKSENSIEIEKNCKICRKSGDCESNHTFLKCILTQEDIYLERIFSCSYCESALIDVESEFKLKSEYFDFYYNICPCCLHLMKYPLCQI